MSDGGDMMLESRDEAAGGVLVGVSEIGDDQISTFQRLIDVEPPQMSL